MINKDFFQLMEEITDEDDDNDFHRLWKRLFDPDEGFPQFGDFTKEEELIIEKELWRSIETTILWFYNHSSWRQSWNREEDLTWERAYSVEKRAWVERLVKTIPRLFKFKSYTKM